MSLFPCLPKLCKIVKWLSAEKSLREQGITETTVVTLRKKYFFSDQNVDKNDFAQLNLLYVQAGVPCVVEWASKLASVIIKLSSIYILQKQTFQYSVHRVGKK